MIDTVKFWGAVVITCAAMVFSGYFSYTFGYNAGWYRNELRHLIRMQPPVSVPDDGVVDPEPQGEAIGEFISVPTERAGE